MPHMPPVTAPSTADLAPRSRRRLRESRLRQKRRPIQQRAVYLDYHASTPCDPRVLEEMLPYFLDAFANPASSVHAAGRKAADAVETARSRIATAINAEPAEIVFTSGATESNNLALLGAGATAPKSRRHVLASAIEHKSVIAPCGVLSERGFAFDVLPVSGDGLLDLGVLAEAASDETFLVSVQAANNEIGTIQPVRSVVQIAHAAGALVHCDAAQALGRMPIDVGDWGVDLLSLSGHKCYGPKGVGALYVRGGARNAPLEPQLHGGGQEHAVRSGTLNVPGIVGLGAAAEFAATEWDSEAERLANLRDWLETQILSRIPQAHRNGCTASRLAGNSSITFPDVEAEALIANLPDLQISTGSACTSGAPEPSHVLAALGLRRNAAYRTVRIGLGRFTTPEDVRDAASQILTALSRCGGAGSPCSATSKPHQRDE